MARKSGISIPQFFHTPYEFFFSQYWLTRITLGNGVLDHFFYRDSHQKELKNDEEKSSTQIQSVDRLEIEFKVACDVIESVAFGKIYGCYDVLGNFGLDFWAIG